MEESAALHARASACTSTSTYRRRGFAKRSRCEPFDIRCNIATVCSNEVVAITLAGCFIGGTQNAIIHRTLHSITIEQSFVQLRRSSILQFDRASVERRRPDKTHTHTHVQTPCAAHASMQKAVGILGQVRWLKHVIIARIGRLFGHHRFPLTLGDGFERIILFATHPRNELRRLFRFRCKRWLYRCH